uniref:Transmembrane protein n=1 Tax=Panagrellus redivivus TaxID=6233 RepID=A0A7E4W786_PANRE
MPLPEKILSMNDCAFLSCNNLSRTFTQTRSAYKRREKDYHQPFPAWFATYDWTQARGTGGVLDGEGSGKGFERFVISPKKDTSRDMNDTEAVGSGCEHRWHRLLGALFLGFTSSYAPFLFQSPSYNRRLAASASDALPYHRVGLTYFHGLHSFTFTTYYKKNSLEKKRGKTTKVDLLVERLI